MSRNIIFVCDHLHGGGAERINIEIARKFLKNGFKVSFILLDGSKFGFEDLEKFDIYDLNIKFKGSLFREKGKKICPSKIEYIKKIEQDLHPELIIFSFAFAYWLKKYFSSSNKWLWVHSELTFFNARKRSSNIFSYLNEIRRIYIEKKCFYRIFNNEKILVVNTDLINFYCEYSNPKEIHFLPNGVNVENIDVVEIKRKEFAIIYVGRLSEEKRIDVAINAFIDSNIEGVMAILGDGPLKNDLMNFVRNKGLEDKVLFFGWRNDPENFIKKSHMLVLTSRTEGYGLVVSEAICLGIPVVAYNTSSGVEYQLSVGELNKGLVKLNDYSDLVYKLKSVYADPYKITAQDKNRLSLENTFLRLIDITGID